MTRRVVITGMGTVNSLASELRSFWHGLCAGRSGIGPIELFDTSAFKVKFGGEVKSAAASAASRSSRTSTSVTSRTDRGGSVRS
jgi:3-oxoacyl-(acyl-carrier-protein) synthase